MKGARIIFAKILPYSANTQVEGDLPVRIKILNWGANRNINGAPVILGAIAERAAKHPLNVYRYSALDYEHNTVEGTPEWKASTEPRAIAGYGEIEIIPGDGAYLSHITYTTEGRRHAPNYRCISAAPICDQDNNVIAFKSVALVRNGAVPGILNVEAVPLTAELTAAVAAITNTEKESDMNYKEELCRLLGLAPDSATDDEIVAALAAKAAEKEAAATAAAEAAAQAADAATTQGTDTVPLAARIAESVGLAIKPIVDQVHSMRAEFTRRDKAELLAAARAEGKVVPLSAGAIASLTVEQLKETIAKLPVTVPLAARTPTNLDDPQLDRGPTAAQADIARRCGMEPATVWPGKTGSVRFGAMLALAALSLALVLHVVAADRDTPQVAGVASTVVAGEALPAGVMAGVWTNGQAYVATTAKKLTIVGRVAKATPAGSVAVLERGAYLLDNVDLTAADIGASCYVWTNNMGWTACKVPSGAISNVMGKVVNITTKGVVVDVTP